MFGYIFLEFRLFLQRGHISATAGASDFKFGMQLGFAKAHHKITRRRKGGRGPGLAELPKFGSFLQYLHNG